MVDKKNIVIKVKYPTSENHSGHTHTQKIITEWNFKRIVIAVLSAVLLLVLLFVFLLPSDTNKTEEPPVSVASDVVDSPLGKPELLLQKAVPRAILTLKIINNEPVGQLELPLKLSKDKSTSIYYFAEVKGMKGRTVYHEWLLEDELITRKKVNISKDDWRTSSRQFFANSIRADWTVRLVDESGQVINQIRFNVIYE